MAFLRRRLFLFCGVLFVLMLGVVSAENCTDECSQLLDAQCYEDGTGYSICTDIDFDGCLEWKDEFVCSVGNACYNGTCMNESEIPDDGSGDSSGSDGSGGSSGSSGCTTTWNCSDWGDCLRGSRERRCAKVNSACGAPSRPDEMLACSAFVDAGGTISLGNGDDDDNDDEASGGGVFFWIVGGIIFVLVVGLALWFFLLRRKKNDSSGLEVVVPGVSTKLVGSVAPVVVKKSAPVVAKSPPVVAKSPPVVAKSPPVVENSLIAEIGLLLDKGEALLRKGDFVGAKNSYSVIKGKFKGVPPGHNDLFIRIKDFYGKIVSGGK